MTSASDSNLSATSNIFDAGGLAALKRQAKSGDPAANRIVAKQFEALFLQMVLKSMRDATPREGLFDSEQTRMYESLLDQQLGQALGGSNRGTGLAAMIEAQLARQNPQPQTFDGPLPLHPATSAYRLPSGTLPLPLSRDAAPTFIPLKNLPVGPAGGALPAPPPGMPGGMVSPSGHPPAPAAALPVTARPGEAAFAVSPVPTFSAAAATGAQRAFVDRLLPAAVAAEQQTGIPAHFMVAQAALETGWGKSEPRRADGSPSFNIFGIKAGASWRGAAVEATTTEVIAGVAQTRVERFRAYGSYEEAFRDYASLLADNPRYAAVLGTQEPARFARGLQAAGFATDPLYASKLERIIGSTTLRQALAG
jgi:flagellar protein FlgJ